MKKTLLALAVLSAFTGVASAQSSVTLSGSVDAGVRRQGTTTGNDWLFAGSQSGYNGITFSGNEDLGGGMRAFFSLNHRFVIGTGVNNSPTNGPAASDPFWRNAWVGAGGGFGDMRLGRMLMPLQDMNGGFDPFATGTVASTHTAGITATIRANNVIYYRSPSLGGLSVHAAIASGDGQLTTQGETGASTQKFFANPKFQTNERPVGLNVRYAAGPINVGIAYDKNSADMKTAGLYGSFDFGAAKLMAQFEKGDNWTAVIGGKAEKIKNFSVGMTAPLGAFLLRAGYLRINSDLPVDKGTTAFKGGDGAKFGIGADYNLSKRTNLYTSFGKWSGDRFNAATKKGRYDFGITHRF